MGAGLIAKDQNDNLLFNTSNITYGLVKSGNLSFIENWRRLELRGINLDPSKGSSWTDSSRLGDNQYGFSVSNAISPIVFIVGKGVSTGFQISGNTHTYMYAGGDANTKYYCFDLMRDDGVNGPGLKTRDINGNITFNSRQTPLNVVTAITAPVPGALGANGKPLLTYVGGRNERINYQTASQSAVVQCIVDIALDGGVEYASFLPWNRGCGCITEGVQGGGSRLFGVSEGSYGRVGGISFIFSPPGRQTEQDYTPYAYTSYESIPSVRPTALVIKTTNLPYPFTL